MTRWSQALTVRQAEVLTLIRTSIASRGIPPTDRELGADLGCSRTNARLYVVALTRKGCVERSRLPGRNKAGSRTLCLVTHTDNMRDMIKKGRGRSAGWPFGSEHGMSKLTESGVIEMRRAYAAGEATQAELGRRHGVGQTMVSNIVCRRAWKHLPADPGGTP